MKLWNHGGACVTNPPALRLAANCWGKSGFRSFSIAPFSQTAPTRILTHAMPFISPGLLSDGTGPLYSTRAAEAGRTGADGFSYKLCARLKGPRRLQRRVVWPRSVSRAGV